MERIDRTYRSATGWPSGAIAASTVAAISSSEGLESDEVTQGSHGRDVEGWLCDSRQTLNRLASREMLCCAWGQIRGAALTVFDSAWYLLSST